MPFTATLPSPHGHHYYETAQLAAFAVYAGLLLGQGYRRGYAARTWLPLVAASTLALVLGCQLVCLPLTEWWGWLRGDADTLAALAGGPRSAVGGAWGVFLAVLLLRRPLGFRGWGVLDAFAGPLAWALAVQSVGCVLAGCCWGEATASGWGVSYEPGTAAYAAQLAQGLLPAGAAHTLALVPTQLLNLLVCAGAGLALHLTRRRRWAAGSRYLLGMGLLCLGRLAVETWRDPASEPLLAEVLTLTGVSLRGLQWLMLAEVLVLLGGWAWWVRRAAISTPAAAPHPAAPVLVGLGLLLVTTRLAPATLAWAEVVTLQALLLLVLLAEGRTWLTTLGQGVPRLAGLPLAALLAAVVLLGTAQAPAPRENPPAMGEGRELTLTGGYLANGHDERPSSGCSSSPYIYNYGVQAGGAEANYKWQPDTAPGFLNAVGGGVWVGTQTISATPATAYPPQSPLSGSLGTQALYDVHLYAERQRGFGQKLLFNYRLGLHLGQLGNSLSSSNSGSSTYYNPYGTTAGFQVLPDVMVAAGTATVFGQYDAGYGAENALGNYAGRLGIGTGFGRPGGGTLLVGITSSNHYSSDNSDAFTLPFASARLKLPLGHGSNSLLLEPYLATDFDRHYHASLKLHYRLGLR